MKSIDLGRATVPLDQYASQGNAILGIRGSGKSYTATYIAERLLDAGVPIVAFDPIGIWRYLRVGATSKAEGYKVVVAGGEHGDIPLTAAGAAEIMRAAMRDGVSIVFDLYDIALSKSDWRRIVEAAMKALLYENKAHGLRHVFLEEAAEFCPQRLPPGDKETASVYSVIERLARMGGNAQLGYTLINQRAEEVNKAVLELCDLLILHRQKGRNSLTALGKWLDVAMAKGHVAAEVPALGNGEAFVWAAGDAPPVKTKIPAKRTFHPDRKAAKEAVAAEAKRVDVTGFVTTMRASLAALEKEASENDPKILRARNRELEGQVEAFRKAAITSSKIALDNIAIEPVTIVERTPVLVWNKEFAKLYNGLEAIAGKAEALRESFGAAFMRAVNDELPDGSKPATFSAPRPAPAAVARPEHREAQATLNRQATSRLQRAAGGPLQRTLDALAELELLGVPQPERVQVAFLAGYSNLTSKGLVNALGSARSAGLIDYPTPGRVALTQAGRAKAHQPAKISNAEELQERLLALLGGVHGRVLKPLIDAYPKPMEREQLAAAAGYTNLTSKGFVNAMGRLRSLGFVDYPSPGCVVALPVLFLQ